MSKFFPSTDHYFPNLDQNSRERILNNMYRMEQVASKAYWIESYIAYLSCLLCSLQLIVLTRKSMMTSSINSLMIGVTMCDIFSMMIVIFARNPLDDDSEFACQAPYSKLVSYILIHCRSFRILVRRCSCWLGVLMAIFRYAIIKSVKTSQRLTSPKFGLKVFLATALASSVLFLGTIFEYEYYVTSYWVPPIQCTQYPAGTFIPVYTLGTSPLFHKWDDFLLIAYENLNGVLSKLLPCILLPIMTVLLCIEVRKTNRVNAMAGITTNSELKKKSERTTFLVIFMMVTFIVCEFPLSISSFLTSVYSENLGVNRIGELIYHICNFVFTTNASIHCIVYFLMSSQYRKTVVSLWNCGKKETSNVVSNVGDISKITLGFYSYWFESYVCYLGALLTVFHLLVLTRKSMMTSAISSLMIGIALCDLGIALILIFVRPSQDTDADDTCRPPYSFLVTHLFQLGRNVRISLRRTSSWLGVLMALFRYLTIKSINPTAKLNSFGFGGKVVVYTLFVSSLITSTEYLRIEFRVVGSWTAPSVCVDLKSASYPVYEVAITALYQRWDGLLAIIDGFVKGVVSKLISGIMFPFLTFLLWKGVRNNQASFDGSGSTAPIKEGIVVVMAVLFTVSELPLAIAAFLQAISSLTSGFFRIGTLLFFACDCVFTTNAAVHCVICLAISSQYRHVVKMVFTRKKYNVGSNLRSAIVTKI